MIVLYLVAALAAPSPQALAWREWLMEHPDRVAACAGPAPTGAGADGRPCRDAPLRAPRLRGRQR